MIKQVVLALLWPLRRFFDPRFEGVADAARSNVAATLEATTIVGRSLAEMEARLDGLAAGLEEVRRETTKASGTYLERLSSDMSREVDPFLAPILDLEVGYKGHAARRGLWFNPPVSVGYEQGDVVVRSVNERIAEVPYVFAAVGRLPLGARVLDVGAAESTVALSLASLGYKVTALDLHPYPFSHPRLRSVVGPIEDWKTDERFEAIVCLSAIEHVGLGAYGEASSDGRPDLDAMRRMLELTKPGGLLVLTTRFGTPAVDELQRTYDRNGIDELLSGWSVEDLTVVRREDATTWTPEDGTPAGAGDEAVALVTATRPKSRARRSPR